MDLLVIFLSGIIVGVVASGAIFIFTNHLKGRLIVVDTDYESKPYIFVEFNPEDFSALKNGNVIELTIERRNG